MPLIDDEAVAVAVAVAVAGALELTEIGERKSWGERYARARVRVENALPRSRLAVIGRA